MFKIKLIFDSNMTVSVSNRLLDLLEVRPDQMKFFLSTLLVWCGLFMIVETKVKFKRIPKKSADDIKNRLVSIIHGMVSFWASFYILLCIG